MFDRPTRLLPGWVGSFWRAFVWWISCAGCAHCVVVHVKTVKTKLSGGTDSNKSNLINYRQAISRNYSRQLYKHIHVVRHIRSTCLLLLLVSKILTGRMFIVFWDTRSHIFQSDPNNNSDSTALFGHELKSGPIYLRWDLKEIGLDLK